MKKETFEIEWGGKPLKIEIGKIANQADGKELYANNN